MNDREELGRLSGGPRDKSLQPAADRLKLPRGAFLAFRQSGGLRFSTREVIVYTDGRVITRRQGKLGAGEGSQRVTPAKIADFKELIAQSGLAGLPPTIGRQSPDGYAYELVVRLNRKSRALEFFDGNIPSEVQPVLAQLQAWLATSALT